MPNEVFRGFRDPYFVEGICYEAAAGATYKAPFPEPAVSADEACDRIRAAIGEYLGHDHLEPAADDMIDLLSFLGDPDLRQWLADVSRKSKEALRRLSGGSGGRSGGVPPTEKQIRFLVKLGVRDFSGSKSEASALIDKLLKARG